MSLLHVTPITIIERLYIVLELYIPSLDHAMITLPKVKLLVLQSGECPSWSWIGTELNDLG